MGKRLNGEGSVVTTEKNGKPYYRAILSITGPDGKVKRKTFNSYKKQEAIRKMREYKEKHDKEVDGKPLYFGDWYLHWVQTFKAGTVQPTTLEGYLVALEKHIKGSRLEFMEVADIGLRDLQAFYKSLEPTCSPGQVHRLYVQINSSLESAVLHGHLATNYSKGVVLRKVVKDPAKSGYRVFSKEDQMALMQALDVEANVVDAVIFLTLYTGLRLGEVLALRWEDYNGKEIDVNEQYQRSTLFHDDGTRETTYVFKKILKTASSRRSVPLPAPAIELLESLASKCIAKEEKGLIFNIEGSPIGRKKPDRRVKSLCRVLGIPARNFHSLRHTYATRLFESGIEPKTVQVLLGHSDIKMTLDIYTHVMQGSKDKAVEALDNLF